MSTKSMVECEDIHLNGRNGKVRPSKSVPTDMFDDFIEERLQRIRSEADGFDADALQIVCHAY